MRSLEIK